MSELKVTSGEVHDLVTRIYTESIARINPDEKREQHKYATLVKNRGDKVFLARMLDESSQIRDSRKLAKRIKILIDQYGVPEFLNSWDTFLFKMYTAFGHHFWFVAIPIIKKRLRKETEKVIIDEARPHLTDHLANRSKEQIGQNVNLLGEVVLGDGEADNRYRHYLEALESPDINYISVKISGIYAQTHALNHSESYPELVDRMTALYRKAIQYPYKDENGIERPKFINLDMEEYKDTRLTLDVFTTTLSKPEFKDYEAGIVIQAYLPDAWDLQTELLEFAKKRVAEGGAPIKMRLVKGANLEMETVNSSLRGWPNPILETKTEVDANYLDILERALQPENAAAVKVGVASHNLFTIAYAYLLSEKYGTQDRMTFEMLEGMANHVWRAMTVFGKHVILYTPVVKDEHFLNAVSYLVRRLDENTGPENFLSHSFDLVPGSEAWEMLRNQFETALSLMGKVNRKPTRTQDRNKPVEPTAPCDVMFNEPDTDFDLPQNREWVKDIFKKWKKGPADQPDVIPLQIGAETTLEGKRQAYKDRCQNDEVTVCEMVVADKEKTERILAVAKADPAKWRDTTLEERHRILFGAADNLSAMRGDLIGCMCAVTGKTVVEGDVEVSEAVDYARFYTTTMKQFEKLGSVEIKPKGTILVISPWNFPCAIPVGGVTAGLAGGNTVILKPATVAAPVAWQFAQAFWDAGVPKEALQVIITDRESLKMMTADERIDHMILTGGTDTARNIIKNNPRTPLSAETGGKNVMIVTASADRDHAILNAVHSAFGNAGQKCSACSLLLVEKSVYDDPVFREKLKDAAISLKTGSVWDPGNIVGPMITNNNDKLLEALDKLEPGEEWLIPPKFLDDKKYILAPTIKWGVRPDNFSFRTELFGPMLSVARIENLEEGIELVNGLEYGLTSGLQSLDEREQKLWRDSVEAGNLYINRGITGAIVNRQPFGGMKLSAFGGGLKAGGPNYCTCFVRISDIPGKVADYKANYRKAYQDVFSKAIDVNDLYGEQNVLRYLPLRSMALRLFGGETPEQVSMVVEAAKVCGTPLTVSLEAGHPLTGKLSGCQVKTENLDSFLASMKDYERIRTCTPDIPRAVYERAAELDKWIASTPPLAEGRVELLNYVKEQSVTFEYHRYGSIMEKPESDK